MKVKLELLHAYPIVSGHIAVEGEKGLKIALQ